MSPLRRAHLKTLGSVRRLRLDDTDTVVVGVSGGPDSTCLLDLLANVRERPEFGFNLHAAHLIHDFRDQEKYVDAQFVQDFCQRWDLPLTVEEVDVAVYQRNKGISSFEQAARDLRYEFLGRVAKTVDAKYVAVAHTADDLAGNRAVTHRPGQRDTRPAGNGRSFRVALSQQRARVVAVASAVGCTAHGHHCVLPKPGHRLPGRYHELLGGFCSQPGANEPHAGFSGATESRGGACVGPIGPDCQHAFGFHGGVR